MGAHSSSNEEEPSEEEVGRSSSSEANLPLFDASNYDASFSSRNAFQTRGGSGGYGREFAGAGGAVGVSLREHVEAEARDTSSEA